MILMVEHVIDRIENGTIYFKKVSPKKITFKAVVNNVEERVDKNNRRFVTVYLNIIGEEKETKWNCFIWDEAEKIKIGNTFICHGVYFGPFKKQLDWVEEIKNKENDLNEK